MEVVIVMDWMMRHETATAVIVSILTSLVTNAMLSAISLLLGS